MSSLLRSRLILVFAGTAASLGVSPAQAQDLHPDWSRVWNRDTQPPTLGSLTIPAGVVLPVTLDRPLASDSARVGDIVTATPVSRAQGDTEFPPGTRLGGVVSQAERASGRTPGVLDVDFQSALLPDGRDVPLHGFIASLDSNSVVDRNGHLIARDGKQVNSWKAVGIGGGAGFVLGRLLKTRTLFPTILGAAGAYLYARSQARWGEDARIATNTTLGMRLEDEVSFPDTSGYAGVRLHFLETRREYRPELYGWNQEVCAPPRVHYNDYFIVVNRPVWVTVDPFDYYGFPLVPLWSERPRFHDRYRDYPRPDYDGGRRGDGDGRDGRPDDRKPTGRFGDGVPFVPARPRPNAPDLRGDSRPRPVPDTVREPKREEPAPTPGFEPQPPRNIFNSRPKFNPFGTRSRVQPPLSRPKFDPFGTRPAVESAPPRPRFDSAPPRSRFDPFGSRSENKSSDSRTLRDAVSRDVGRRSEARKESRGGRTESSDKNSGRRR